MILKLNFKNLLCLLQFGEYHGILLVIYLQLYIQIQKDIILIKYIQKINREIGKKLMRKKINNLLKYILNSVNSKNELINTLFKNTHFYHLINLKTRTFQFRFICILIIIIIIFF